MSRPLRIEYPGAYYHVTARGVARQDIFPSDGSRWDFLQLLAAAHERWGIVYHGYCLMGNHYHLEIESPDGYLSRPMQWVNHKHAATVNWRQDRVGHLFQGRFSSAVVEAESHLHELTRYIHLNPVRAGLVAHPADYAWSSYGAYVGLAPKPAWLQTERTLGRFGKTPAEQRRRYREFVESPDVVVANPLRELAFGAVVGNERFVEWVRLRFAEDSPEPEVSHQVKIRPPEDLEVVAVAVSQALGVTEADLRAKGRPGNGARDLALYVACRLCRSGLADAGERFGGVRPSAASLACRRVEQQLAEDESLQRRLADVLRRLTVHRDPTDGHQVRDSCAPTARQPRPSGRGRRA